MSMVTRCPACNTIFRVTPQQLQAQQGQVRCGRCMNIFDGYSTLGTMPEDTSPAKPGPATAPGAGATPAPAFELEPVEPRAEQAAAATAPPAYVIEDERDYGPEPEQLSLEDQLFLEEARTRRNRSTRLWAAAAAVAAVALAGQAIYTYRSELAAQVPGVRRPLVQLCELVGCSVPLPQRPKRIAIEASDLLVLDPARPGVIQLTATLRNHAGYDLAYPALDLVLTNTKEHTLARRIFLPSEYLEQGRDVASGIAANAEITVRLNLDTGDLNAAGFRLDLLPAP